MSRSGRWKTLVPACFITAAVIGLSAIAAAIPSDATGIRNSAAKADTAVTAGIGRHSETCDDSALETAWLIATGLTLLGLGWRRS
jgi:hypothetical protein